MEAVAADALGVEALAGWRSGRRQRVWPRWKAVSKQATCGRSGERASSDADRREIVRLVQRRERDVALEIARARLRRPAPAGRNPGRHARRDGRPRSARAAASRAARRLRCASAAGTSATSLRRVGPRRSAARRRRRRRAAAAATPMPSIWPLISRSRPASPSIANTWNLTLDEPALTTRIVSMALTPPAARALLRRACA